MDRVSAERGGSLQSSYSEARHHHQSRHLWEEISQICAHATMTQTKERVTFCLDLVSLVERKIALEELWLVEIGCHFGQLVAVEMRWAWERGKTLETTYAQVHGVLYGRRIDTHRYISIALSLTMNKELNRLDNRTLSLIYRSKDIHRLSAEQGRRRGRHMHRRDHRLQSSSHSFPCFSFHFGLLEPLATHFPGPRL